MVDREHRRRGADADGVVITDARSAASAEQKTRQKRYAITMAFRTACFIAAIFVPGAARWVLIAGAVFLPYVAVVAANQTYARSSEPRPGDLVDPEPLPQLTTGFETISVDPDVDLDDPDGDAAPDSGRGGDRAA